MGVGRGRERMRVGRGKIRGEGSDRYVDEESEERVGGGG